MGDLIDRKALDKALTTAAANDKSKNTRVWAKAICVLHDAPAVDAVPVVRCRECIHSDETGVLPKGVLCCNTNGMPIPEDGYCNRWKRKEDK